MQEHHDSYDCEKTCTCTDPDWNDSIIKSNTDCDCVHCDNCGGVQPKGEAWKFNECNPNPSEYCIFEKQAKDRLHIIKILEHQIQKIGNQLELEVFQSAIKEERFCYTCQTIISKKFQRCPQCNGMNLQFM